MRCATGPLRAFLLLLLCAAPAAAQNPLARDCRRDVVLRADPASYGAGWAALHPARLLDAGNGMIDDGRWLEAVQRTSATLEPALARAAVLDPTATARFRSELTELVRELEAIRGTPGADSLVRTAAGVVNTRFAIVTDEVDGIIVPALFPADPVHLTASTDSAVRRPLCWGAIALDSMLFRYAAPGEALVLAEMRRLGELWENLAGSGFRPTLIEQAVNNLGRAPRESLEPPAGLWVVAHPTIGQLGARADGDTDVEQVAILDFGRLWYTASRSDYLMLTLALALGDQVVGVGPNLRYGPVSLGYVWDMEGGDGHTNGMIGTVDLVSLLGGGMSWAMDRRETITAEIREELAGMRERDD